MATYPVYPATTFTQAVELTIFASNQLHDVINGDALTTVETENGDIPTLRKALVDNFYFKTPINWVEGESATVFNQLYYFEGSIATSGWYYAPQATLDNPIAMGSTPLDDDNWRLYQTATQSIPAQVYPWATEITQVTSSIVPPYEFDTAIVTYNSLVLVPGKDYTIANNTLTFTPPLTPEPDAEVPDILFCYIGKLEEGNPNTNYVTYNSLAASTAAGLIGTSSGDSIQGYLNKLADNTSTGGLNLIGVNQGGKLKDYIKEVTYEALGAKFDGITDDTAAIQAGNELVKQGYLVKAVTPNGRARITSQVTFYAGSGAVDMGTAYLKPDRNLMTTGYAARIIGDNTKTYNLGSRLRINMIGPYGEIGEKPPADTSTITTQLCGLDINPGTTTQVSDLDIWWKIFGFMKNVRIGSKSVYLIRAHSPMHSKAWVRNVEFDCQNDAGENITFFGGKGADCTNSTKTGTDIYSTAEGQYLGLNLIGYSQDYNDVDLDINGGYVHKISGQFENNSTQPYVKMTYTSGRRHPTVILQTVNIDGGNDLAQEAGNKGKPAWFKIGNGCIFHADGGTWGKYDKMHSIKLFDVSANGPIALSVKNIYFDTYDGVDSIEWGAHGNPIRNYDFSSLSIAGWKTEYLYPSGGTPVTPTITYDGSKSIGNAAKISSSSTGGQTTTLFGQKIPVIPGGILYASTNLYWENIVSSNGNAYFGYTFYDAFGDEITHSNIGINLNAQPANATTPVLCSGKVRVPSGAAFVHVGIRHYQISGDIWIGKMNAFVE